MLEKLLCQPKYLQCPSVHPSVRPSVHLPSNIGVSAKVNYCNTQSICRVRLFDIYNDIDFLSGVGEGVGLCRLLLSTCVRIVACFLDPFLGLMGANYTVFAPLEGERQPFPNCQNFSTSIFVFYSEI